MTYLKTNLDFWLALINSLLIIVYSFFYFFEQINSASTTIVYESYQFWIVIGCLIYLAGTLFVFLYTADIKDKAYNNSLWVINLIFEIIKYACFDFALILAKNNTRNSSFSYDVMDTNTPKNPF